MEVSNHLEQILELLGRRADQVAATLHANGIKGVRNTVRHLNPIVRFSQLHIRLDDYGLDVTHGDGMAKYTLRLILPNGKEEDAPLPEPVREFLDSFNKGAYPQLEV
jgi:hypothetical protein